MNQPTMFCFQCQETQANTGCTVKGVCGKTAEIAALQDLLLYATKGLCQVTTLLRKEHKSIARDINYTVCLNLFRTITNANLDATALEQQIKDTLNTRDILVKDLQDTSSLHAAATFQVQDRESMLALAKTVGILATPDEDIRSLKELITYGLKGLCAYLKHANVLGYYDENIDSFIQMALAKMLDANLSIPELQDLLGQTGTQGLAGMALLDTANRTTYGDPQISTVQLGVRKNPGILISGHDLKDLAMLLEQAEGQGIDVYTHSEMLPAHYYPAFQKYSCFAGNYGNAWWKQHEEFESFNGPILLTTNCVIPPKDSYKNRLFTTGAVDVSGCQHIYPDKQGQKDFSALINLAKTCAAPKELETGTIVGGFAHQQVTALSEKIIAAVKSGAVKKFVVMAGCDGRHKSRAYYQEFASKLPKDTVILTAGCAKYKYIKLPLGSIGDIPRVLDAGQCNDCYSWIMVAQKLMQAFGLKDVNDLPIVYNIAWYEQKAVIVLLVLLTLGIKNIHLGPTLPAFLSPNIAQFLVKNFGISGITTVDDDLKIFGLA